MENAEAGDPEEEQNLGAIARGTIVIRIGTKYFKFNN